MADNMRDRQRDDLPRLPAQNRQKARDWKSENERDNGTTGQRDELRDVR
jgi:hypothetical protein